MSKNVAVFVDVANIFYAAKAAGVDIDYVTLLKAATAGRDFVRAYAYTGLDPENENQRQFHAFLARSGYKVISKDIRKYGDGRIKANLDIELVVDMMRMAEHLDIAVVVSGDGDFAPAIRAVQQMGVRVEVVSFRGNTSSDLIEVADVFTDIGQIARVEKGARSGRRVAAEGDLSMTEVPEKETEGPVRRRRGTRRPAEREPAVAAIESIEEALPGNVIVLPGERLSRVEVGEEPTGVPTEVPVDEPAATAAVYAGGDAEATEDGDGRRRRRRRGGRGRGRGRRPETEALPVGESYTEGAAEGLADEEEFLDESPVALPQHSTFGSVWDSQLGVPTAPHPAASTEITDEEEEYEDEPEIPEYLLAERRRQASRQQRGRGGRGGGGSYRTALDRERYGRGGAPSYGGGAGNRLPPRDRGGRDARSQTAPSRGRPPFREQERPVPAAQAPRPAPSAEPWSEVPPEVAELLKAELARRSGLTDGTDTLPEAPARPARRSPRRATQAPPASAETLVEEAVASDAGSQAPADVAAKAPAKRTPRARKAPAAVAAESPPEDVAADAPKRRTTRRTTKPADAQAATAASDPGKAASDEAATPAAKPRRRTAARKPSSTVAAAPSEGTAAAEPGSGEG